jgi:hypothetical protein
MVREILDKLSLVDAARFSMVSKAARSITESFLAASVHRQDKFASEKRAAVLRGVLELSRGENPGGVHWGRGSFPGFETDVYHYLPDSETCLVLNVRERVTRKKHGVRFTKPYSARVLCDKSYEDLTKTLDAYIETYRTQLPEYLITDNLLHDKSEKRDAANAALLEHMLVSSGKDVGIQVIGAARIDWDRGFCRLALGTVKTLKVARIDGATDTLNATDPATLEMLAEGYRRFPERFRNSLGKILSYFCKSAPLQPPAKKQRMC